VAQPVTRVGRRRLEATHQLVPALRPGLEQRQTALDRALDPDVVRQLEVEELDRPVGPPVAAVERALGLEEESAGDGLAVQAGAGEEHRLGQLAGQRGEEAGLEVGVPAVLLDGRSIEPIDRGQVVLAQRRPRHQLDRLDRGPRPRPLLPQLLALARREAGEEAVEVAIARVVPVELERQPRREAGRVEQGLLLLGHEQEVDRRAALGVGDLADPGAEQGDQPGARRVGQAGGEQEAPPGRRRHRRRDHQLRVVRDPGPPARARPLPVEDVLAIGVPLDEGGDRADQAAGLLDEQVARRPAGARTDRARGLEGGQEAVAQEGRGAVVERIPGQAIDLGDGADLAQTGGRVTHHRRSIDRRGRPRQRRRRRRPAGVCSARLHERCP
jgi:hypothetical protein